MYSNADNFKIVRNSLGVRGAVNGNLSFKPTPLNPHSLSTSLEDPPVYLMFALWPQIDLRMLEKPSPTRACVKCDCLALCCQIKMTLCEWLGVHKVNTMLPLGTSQFKALPMSINWSDIFTNYIFDNCNFRCQSRLVEKTVLHHLVLYLLHGKLFPIANIPLTGVWGRSLKWQFNEFMK